MISTTTSSCSTKSMEDVWKDISLASLSRNASDNTTTSTHHPTAAAFRGITFQDFLASTSTTSSNIDPPPPAAASTVLRLNCGTRSDLKQHLLETTSATITGPALLKPNPITRPTSTSVTTTTTRPNSLNNPSSVFPSCCKKRALDDHDQNREDHHNSTNGRHKRMMKNRESAARSRARKQAYTNELEIEIAQLREENARLKRQLQAKSMINSSCLAPSTLAQRLLPKRQTLFRTSTAPF
nr:protein FD-like [Malus domestica]